MADKLPPLPAGAQTLPPLPVGAETVSGGSPDGQPEDFSLKGYLSDEIGKPVSAAVDRLKDEFWHPGKYPPTIGDVLAVPEAAVGGAVDAAVVNPLATGLSYLHPQKMDAGPGLLGFLSAHPRPATKEELKGDVRGALSALGPEAKAAAPAAAVPGASDVGLDATSRLGKAAERVASKGKPPATSAAASAPPGGGKPPAGAAPPPGTPPVGSDYQAAVTGLEKEGITLTPGQKKGGWWRRQEEAHKSNPLVGQAIRDAENKSIESMNKAVYNRVLGHIGQKYEGEAIGNEGVKKVGDTLNTEYEKLKPKLKSSYPGRPVR